MVEEISSAVEEVFQVILSSDESNLISNIRKTSMLSNYTERAKDTNYPLIPFSILGNELPELLRSGNEWRVSDILKLGESPLSKLLLAMAWKQNDLLKLRSIVAGIESVGPPDAGARQFESNTGLVFFHFGRHLADPINNPVIDQHVLRAFGVYMANGNAEQIRFWQRWGSIIGTAREKKTIEEYLDWYNQLLDRNIVIRDQRAYLAEVDFVLMQLGRKLKEEK